MRDAFSIFTPIEQLAVEYPAVAALQERCEKLQWDVAAWEVVHSRIGELLMPHRLPTESTVFETVERLLNENAALKAGKS